MIDFTESIILHRQGVAEKNCHAKVIELKDLVDNSTAVLEDKSCFLLPPNEDIETGDIIGFNSKIYRIAKLHPCRDISGVIRGWKVVAIESFER